MLTQDDRMLIGKVFRNKRDELHLTQEQLAELFSDYGITAKTYKRVERGSGKVSLERLLDIASVLSVDIKDYLPDFPFSLKPKNTGDQLSLNRFLLYLPLIDPWILFDSLLRIGTQFDVNPYYTKQQLDHLYASIPDSPEKLYADLQYQNLLSGPVTETDSDQEQRLKWRQRHSPEIEALYAEYEQVIRARRSYFKNQG